MLFIRDRLLLNLKPGLRMNSFGIFGPDKTNTFVSNSKKNHK